MVPTFQEIMLPLLKLVANGQEMRLSDAIDVLASGFHLTEEDRKELLPSGRQSRFANRVGWAKTYLTRAQLLDPSERGIVRITDRGRQVLAEDPPKIDLNFLRRYPEIEEFRSVSGTSRQAEDEPPSERTPEEIIESNYQLVMQGLEHELLQQVKERSPAFFENLVIDLLVRMGYGGTMREAAERIGRSGDGGIDGIIKEDKLGLDVVYIQAKRWDGTVGRPTVQAFAGSLEGHRARKGVLITTSRFSDDALDYVRMIEKRIVLIDGAELVRYMIEHGLGVTEVSRFSIKRVALEELDYFEEKPALPIAGALETGDSTGVTAT